MGEYQGKKDEVERALQSLRHSEGGNDWAFATVDAEIRRLRRTEEAADTPRSRTPTSGFSLRMPRNVRRRIRIAAALDDTRVADWAIERLDRAARERIDCADRIPNTSGTERRLTVDQVIEAVADFFQTTPEGLALRSRRRDVLKPRQVAMYLCRRYTDAPVAAIAAAFNREHTAVANAEEMVASRISEPSTIRDDVEALSKILDAMKIEGSSDGEAEGT